jgi:hypothetical protein
MRLFLRLLLVFLLLVACLNGKEKSNEVKRILVGSPVCQKPTILKEFLQSLKELETSPQYTVDYFFIDDNHDAESIELLQQFKSEFASKTSIFNPEKNDQITPYLCDENGHHWTLDLMWKVGDYKDRILQKARDQDYDYVFLIDSDVLIQPLTLTHLIKADKAIIASIYWTDESQTNTFIPQIWLLDYSTLYPHRIRESLSPEERNNRQEKFLNQLKVPGIYEVGGVAGCTLISREALDKKISFKRLKNMTYPDEDRYFSIRASALDIDLYVDTNYPAFHVYRESDLSKVPDFKKCTSSPKADLNRK